MDKNSSWETEVKDKLSHISEITEAQMKARKRQSIYKLPTYVTNLNLNAYKPRAVSFGPYHYGEPDLKPNEAHKERALLHFLKRSGKSLAHYLSALGEVVEDLKGAYDSLDRVWEQDSEAFLQLMIRDGCFMLEILRAFPADQRQKTMDGYAYNDPVFSNRGGIHMMLYIHCDMLVLENQLPILLLETLLAAENPDEEKDEEFINKLIFNFYWLGSLPEELGKCLHVLDAYRKILLRKRPYGPAQWTSISNHIISDARSLKEAGIRIKKNESESAMDIKFDRHSGILRLPQITVDDSTESKFLNLIAFERFHAGVGNEVIDFCFFMDDIIDNVNDVNILENREIILNASGSDEAVAKLFNSLTKDVSLSADSSLNAVRQEIKIYCKQKLHKWRASLIGTYFRNPWAIISVIAAIALFGLAITQTIYTALQYYQH